MTGIQDAAAIFIPNAGARLQEAQVTTDIDATPNGCSAASGVSPFRRDPPREAP